VPVIANNRVGEEVFAKSSIKFYGGSFISGQHGQVLAQVSMGGALDLPAALPVQQPSWQQACHVFDASTQWKRNCEG
jgi:hypothetical protein